MNRSLTNVLFGGAIAPASQETHKIEGTLTKTNVEETVEILSNADSVILVNHLPSTDSHSILNWPRLWATGWLSVKPNSEYQH